MYHKIAIVAVLGIFATATSCKKEVSVVEKPLVLNSKEEVSIAKLKLFMSKLTYINADSIQYNPGSEQFVWRGINQISREELLFAYKQHNEQGDK